jgi:hypothetical protein
MGCGFNHRTEEGAGFECQCGCAAVELGNRGTVKSWNSGVEDS